MHRLHEGVGSEWLIVSLVGNGCAKAYMESELR